MSLLVLMTGYIFTFSWNAWQQIGFAGFLSSDRWLPLEGQYGLLGSLAGTFALAVLSCIWAVPVGFLTALYICFYGGKTSKWILAAFELMAGVPSVVYGIFGLTVVVPLIAKIAPPGPSLLAGTLVLGAMLVPTIILFMVHSFQKIPQSLTHAVAALDIRPSTAVFFVYWPLLKGSLLTAAVLSLTRALGETMVVLMVCGNIPGIPDSLFDPVRTLTANIALEMAYALSLHQSALFFCGALLISVTIFGVLLTAQIQRDKDEFAGI